MPIHPHLDGVLIDVAYRGSAEPQIVDVRLEAAGPAELPLAPWAIGSLVSCVNRGLAGGSDFAPAVGRAVLEAGPTGEGPNGGPDELGPAYAFRLALTGVSPRFLRVFVESLAASGHPQPLRSIAIVGSLPTDGSALSVRDGGFAGWLEDPKAYPGMWRDVGFRLVTRAVPRGATLRAVLGRGTTDEVGGELEEVFSAWQSAVATYPSATGRRRGVMDPHGSFARTRTEFFAKVMLFDHDRETTRAALVNALARFHATVAPLASVEIGMP